MCNVLFGLVYVCSIVQVRYEEITAEAAYLDKVLSEGADRATEIAESTIHNLKQAMGFYLWVSVSALCCLKASFSSFFSWWNNYWFLNWCSQMLLSIFFSVTVMYQVVYNCNLFQNLYQNKNSYEMNENNLVSKNLIINIYYIYILCRFLCI